MTTIVTRAGKGSALSHTEMDANFTNLNTYKLDGYADRLNAAATTTLATAQNTNLAFPIGASENWNFQADLVVQCSSTGGVKVAVSVPAGATISAVAFGNGATVTAFTTGVLTASGTLTTVNFSNVATTNLHVRITGSVLNSTTAGNVTIQFAATTAGQTATIQAGSTLKAVKSSAV